MDVDLTAEQSMLVEATRAFLDARYPTSRLRELMAEPGGLDPGGWEAAAGLGWQGLLAAEAYGGAGLGGRGVVEAAAVAELLGRSLHPGPLLPVSVAAYAVGCDGSPEQREATLPGLVDGTVIAAWALAEGPGAWDASGLTPTATPDGDGYVIRGTKRWVQDAGSAGMLLVTCRDPDGPMQLLIPAGTEGVTVTPLSTADLGRRFSDVHLDGVRVGTEAVLGGPAGLTDREGVTAGVGRQLALAVSLQCAESVGATGRVLEKTVAYAKDRMAFGRAIGSFQAVKHRLAEAATWLEAAQAVTWDAVHAVAGDRPDTARATHVAKAFVARHCPRIVEDCMQVHGGVAMTWEDDCHLYLRRVRTNAVMFGTAEWHADRLCDAVGLRP